MIPLRAFVVRPDMPQVKGRVVDYLHAIPVEADAFEVVIRPHDPTRTIEQNSLAWLIVTAIAEQVWPDNRQFSKDVWWLQLKKDFFGPNIVELPDGSFLETEPESRGRGKKKFSDWLEFLFITAVSFGVVLPDEAVEYRRRST